jgi:DNA polymerase III delta subunit
MVIFLYGEDSYRRLQKQKEILEAYHKKYGNLSYDKFDLAEDNDTCRLKEFVANRSMFDKVKLAVVDNVFKTSDKKIIKTALKENLENKDVLFLVNSDKKPAAEFKFLMEDPVQSQEFPPLDGVKLNSFINKETLSRGFKLPPETINSLKEFFKNDSWGLVTELDKIALMKDKEFENDSYSDRNYFELIGALRNKRNMPQSLIALEVMLSEHRDDAARIFNSLSYFLRDRESAELFADYDVAIKSGKFDYEEALLDFVIS